MAEYARFILLAQHLLFICQYLLFLLPMLSQYFVCLLCEIRNKNSEVAHSY